MKILDVTYEDIDDAIDKYLDSEEAEQEDDEGYLLKGEDLGEDIIIAQGPAWRVTDKNLIFMEGVYCTFIEELDAYDVDFSLTLIYEDVPDEKFNPENYVYFEQDPPMTAIHNYKQQPIIYISV